MKRYRVGAHVMIRVEIEVEANSPIEALGKVDDEDVRRAAERGEFPAIGAVELVSARPIEDPNPCGDSHPCGYSCQLFRGHVGAHLDHQAGEAWSKDYSVVR